MNLLSISTKTRLNPNIKRKINNCIHLTEYNNLTINLTKYIKLDYDFRKDEKEFRKKYYKNIINYKNTNHTNNKKVEYINNNKGICMCLVVKNQIQYIKDFVIFYKKMGVKKIFLYDNSDFESENYKLEISEEMKNSFVEVINMRGYCAIQLIVYTHCYDINKQNFDWFLFFDTDEYIFIEKNKTLIDYLYDEKFKHCKYIKLNWRFYTDNEMLYYSNKSVVERFTVPSSYQMMTPKSIIRGGLKDEFLMTAHYPIFISNCCNSEGGYEVPDDWKMSKLYYKKAYIRHYFTKTIEEYCDKINLGSVFYGRYRVEELIDIFYLINNVTSIKIKMLKTCLNESGFSNTIQYLNSKKKTIL